VETLAEAQHQAERLGYPLLIKATAGGGGHGIRRVNSSAQLALAFEGARAEAFKAFGNATVFMEQLVTGARHIEVQVIADHHGTTWPLGVRDCTIQRRHQKVMEEAPSPALTSLQDQALREAAVRLSQAAEYHNAGTVEFLYQPESHRFSFMEMNTRLSGRASSHRMHHRLRPGQAADPCRAWRTPGSRATEDDGARGRSAAECRRSGERFRAGARHDRALPAGDRPRSAH
jgi:biotin carboxylase